MKNLKRSLGILASAILIFGLLAGTALPAEPQTQTPPPRQIEEEFWNKLAQDLALMSLSFQLELEKETVDEVISRLEKFQTDDAALKEKIGNDWLPVFKEYQKALENLNQAVEKFSERKDIIPKGEIETELSKHCSPELENRVSRIFDEMEKTGVLQKLQEQE